MSPIQFASAAPTSANADIGKIRDVPLEKINLDQRAQPRDHVSTEKVGEYAEAMAAGETFPPLVVFYDGKQYWLADGFHRHYAATGAGLKAFRCEVHKGGVRDAILYSVGANATHGYPRTNADKRRAVLTLLQDAEWSTWSDRDIARRCRVGHPLVARIKAEVAPPVTGTNSSDDATRTYRDKHGNTSKMKTSGINAGRSKKAAAAPAENSDVGRPSFPSEPTDPVGATSGQSDGSSTEAEEAATAEARAEIERRHANGFISSALWKIEEQFGTLPEPEVAAANFPEWHVHTFSSSKAIKISDWFAVFAREFSKHEEIVDDDTE